MTNNTSNINDVSFDLTSLNPIIDTFISTYKSTLENKGKRASGALIDTIKHKIKVRGKWIEIYLRMEDYWKWVELGRKPGKFPPPDAIKRWIDIKPVLPRPYTGNLPTKPQLAYRLARKIVKGKIRSVNASEFNTARKKTIKSLTPSKDQLAFLIGRKIYREGIEPTYALRDTIREFDLYNKIYNTIVDSIQQKITEEIENEI